MIQRTVLLLLVVHGLASCSDAHDTATAIIPNEPISNAAGIALAAGDAHTCAIRAVDRAVECTGFNDKGQLGLAQSPSDLPQKSEFAPVAAGLKARQITAGAAHTCAIGVGGKIYCWGANDRGQLGVPSSSEYITTPTLVSAFADRTAVLIAAGAQHTCATFEDNSNEVSCWGDNVEFQLGSEAGGGELGPIKIALADAVTQLTAGGTHTCVIVEKDGNVLCWGGNSSGELGDGTTERRAAPTPVAFGDDSPHAFLVAAGASHTCMAVEGSGILCWGKNDSGQLGLGVKGDVLGPQGAIASHVPQAIRPQFPQPPMLLVAGSWHTCATFPDAADEPKFVIRCWGGNISGQLGIGTSGEAMDRSLIGPKVVGPFGYSAVDISLGAQHSCAILVDETGAVCWGSNAMGQLGRSDGRLIRTAQLGVGDGGAPNANTVDGVTNCGSAGSELCRVSLPVTGGSFKRLNLPSANATVSNFSLDKYEVTVGRFRQFVEAVRAGWRPVEGSGRHLRLNGGKGLVDSSTPNGYETGWRKEWNNEVLPTGTPSNCSSNDYPTWTNNADGLDLLPMNCVNWYEMVAFTIFDDAVMPSAAEWLYAASGGAEQRKYPWGGTEPDATLATFECAYGLTDGESDCVGVQNIPPVGSAPLGIARWGQVDVAGSVAEWTIDSFAPAFGDDCIDCANLEVGRTKLVLGGFFGSDPSELLTTTADKEVAEFRHFGIGGRCLR